MTCGNHYCMQIGKKIYLTKINVFLLNNCFRSFYYCLIEFVIYYLKNDYYSCNRPGRYYRHSINWENLLDLSTELAVGVVNYFKCSLSCFQIGRG